MTTWCVNSSLVKVPLYVHLPCTGLLYSQPALLSVLMATRPRLWQLQADTQQQKCKDYKMTLRSHRMRCSMAPKPESTAGVPFPLGTQKSPPFPGCITLGQCTAGSGGWCKQA